ncbi:MAG: glycoside hydrolase family 35 protein [Cellulosilyticaceae bacterium]
MFNLNPDTTILSGAIHYFRVLKSDYHDRLTKLKACGFNTVETYVPWNLHEPSKGHFEFGGHFDLEYFLEVAHELGLYVIMRPGPYICAEWDFGGFPSWLLADKNLPLRCFDQAYLKHVDEWFDVLIPKLVPYLRTKGGPIIAVQVENEYGSYGDDKRYLQHMQDLLVHHGIDVPLFTSDGGTDFMLTGGTLPNVFKTVNFGSGPNENFDKLLEFQPDEPLMCMEFWDGWFDHWGDVHHTRPSEEVTQVFEDMLDRNAHVNFYMFHGGTNFGFYSGANYYDDRKYMCTTTSYDYNAPLTEAGDITDTYLKIREICEARFGKIPYDIPANKPKRAYGQVTWTHQALLFDNLDNLTEPIQSATPLNMEALGQDFGYILYRKQVEGPRENMGLRLEDVRDRAQIFVNGMEKTIYHRNEPQTLNLPVPKSGLKLDVLVENLGRINYGSMMTDYKGVTKGITHGERYLFGYDIYPLPMKDLSQLNYNSQIVPTDMPAFYRGTFQVDTICDTFLDFSHLTKGFVLINGFNIGRYWNIGPANTLFIPSGLLHTGANDIVIFEQHGTNELDVTLIDHPVLDRSLL